MTPVTILSSVLDAASHECAIGRMQADLTLLAVKGFSPGRTGLLAMELRDIAAKYVEALDVVISACAVESSPNVVRFKGAPGSALPSARAVAKPTTKPQPSTANVSVFE